MIADEQVCVVLQGVLQQLDQGLLIQPKDAQAGHDEVVRHSPLPVLGPKEQLQLPVEPGQHRLEDLWVLLEQGHPDVGLEAAQSSPGHWPHSSWSGGCGAMGNVGIWASVSSPCLLDNDWWLCGGCDDNLWELIIRSHQVHNGADAALAEEAVSFALLPVQDAAETELVEAWHYIDDVVPGLKANRAAAVELRDHTHGALRQMLGRAEDEELLSPLPALQQQVPHCKRKRGHGHLLAWGGWKETLRAPPWLRHFMFPPRKGPGSGCVAGCTPNPSAHPTAALGWDVPAQLTSAAVSVPTGHPSCLNQAGLGQILWYLWGWALRPAVSSSQSTTPAPSQSLALSSRPHRRAQLEWRHETAGQDAAATQIQAWSQPIAWGCHRPLLEAITGAILTPGTHPSSTSPPAHMPLATTVPLSAPSPTSFALCSPLAFHITHEGLGHDFPGPHQVTLSMVHISRQIRQEDSFDNTSCLPLRLQDKVLWALPTVQYCWQALWAPLVPAMEVKSNTWFALGDFLLLAEQSNGMAAAHPKLWVSTCWRGLHPTPPTETPQATVTFPSGFWCLVPAGCLTWGGHNTHTPAEIWGWMGTSVPWSVSARVMGWHSIEQPPGSLPAMSNQSRIWEEDVAQAFSLWSLSLFWEFMDRNYCQCLYGTGKKMPAMLVPVRNSHKDALLVTSNTEVNKIQ